jgi:hypothetical protein
MSQPSSWMNAMAGKPETTPADLDMIQIEEDGTRLLAYTSARNGIRIDLLNPEVPAGWWRCFELTPYQAETIGAALLRWASQRKGTADAI